MRVCDDIFDQVLNAKVLSRYGASDGNAGQVKTGEIIYRNAL